MTATGSDPRTIEIHDASFLALTAWDEGAIVRLCAFVIDGVENDYPSGWWQDIELRCWNARVKLTGPGECWITDGFTRANGTTWNNEIPIPFDESGEVALSAFGSGIALDVECDRMVLELVGAPHGRESGSRSEVR